MAANASAALVGVRYRLIAHKAFLTRRDVFASCPTAIHARVLSGWHAILAVGCGHLVLFDPDPATTATFLSRYRPTVVDTFPNLYIRWEQFAIAASSVRLAMLATLVGQSLH